jgi:hypothetical protein
MRVGSFHIYTNLNFRLNHPIMGQISDGNSQNEEIVISNNQTTVTYSKKQVMLNVAKQVPSEAYRVKLPKGDFLMIHSCEHCVSLLIKFSSLLV